MARFKIVTDIIIYGNFLIASAAVALAVESNILLSRGVVFRPYYLVVFFATFFVYNLHRYIGSVKDKDNNAERNAWAIRNKPLILAFILLGAAGLLVSLLYLKMQVGILLIPLCVITLGYSIPVLKRKADTVRLRDLPWAKTFLIGAVWTGVTVVLPGLRETVNYLSSDFLLLCLERFLFIFAITIPFDIRDIKDDRNGGVISIAVSLGEKRSKLLAEGLLLLFTVVVILHYRGTPFCWPLLISAGSTLYLVSLTSPLRKEAFYLFWLDGAMILQFMLVFAFAR